jgi:hypothetical protein
MCEQKTVVMNNAEKMSFPQSAERSVGNPSERPGKIPDKPE